MRQRIVVIGAGYAGVRMMERLRHHKKAEIIVLDQNPYHYLQTDVYGYVANKTGFNDITIDLYTLMASHPENVQFMQKKATRIRFDDKVVETEDNLEVHYDYLVLATGTRTFLPDQVEGLLEHWRHGIKSIPHALKFKQAFEQNMFKMIESEGTCSVNSAFNIVVGGGGLSGVEIAAEMAYYAKRMYNHFGYLCEGVQVILINSGDQILKGTDPYLIEVSTNRLKELGVEIIYNRRIAKVTPSEVFLDDGTQIPMHFLIWTGGIFASPLIRDLALKKNAHHQLEVDPFYRVPGVTDVFAIGDTCQLIDPVTGERRPPTAQMAELSGAYVARNLGRILDGQAMQIEKLDMQGMFVALGGAYGAGVAKGMKFKGLLAHLFKMAIVNFYKWPLQQRCRIGYRRIKRQEKEG